MESPGRDADSQSGATRDDRQAVLAEPPMLVQLEKAIEAQCQVGDPRWMALLGQWMQASACMRYVHFTRSDVLAFTGSTVHVLGQASLPCRSIQACCLVCRWR